MSHQKEGLHLSHKSKALLYYFAVGVRADVLISACAHASEAHHHLFGVCAPCLLHLLSSISKKTAGQGSLLQLATVLACTLCVWAVLLFVAKKSLN